MESTHSNARMALALISAALIIAVLVFVLQLPSLSIRSLVVGERVVGDGQFWLLEFIAGAINSAIISEVVALLFRRLVLWVGVMSVVMQLAWMAFTQSFVAPADSFVEIAFRSAESMGILVGAAVAVLVTRGAWTRDQ